MKYRLELTAQAEAEIEEAYRWIREDSPSRASAWRQGLLETAQTLKTFPERCPLAPESAAFGREIRHLLYGKRGGVYRLLFEIRGHTVYILHVRHGARRHMTPEEA